MMAKRDASAEENNNSPAHTVIVNMPPVREPKARRMNAVEDVESPTFVDEVFNEPDEYEDPLTDYLQRWNHVQGFYINLVRLPDPPDMENYFARPNYEPMNHGRLRFNPPTLVADVQKKMRSGGRVRIQLLDSTGKYVKEGGYTGNIGDPDAAYFVEPLPAPVVESSPAPTIVAPASAPVDPIRAAMETAMARRLERMFDDPPTPPPAPAPKAELSDEDRMTLAFARSGNMVGQITSNIVSTMSQATAGAQQPVTTFDKILTAATTFPDLTLKIFQRVDRVIDRFAPARENPETDAEEDDAADGDDEPRDEATDANGKGGEQPTILDYLIEQCAENSDLTMQDAKLSKFATENPEEFAQIKKTLKSYSAEAVIGHISTLKREYALVLKAPHVRGWFERFTNEAMKHTSL